MKHLSELEMAVLSNLCLDNTPSNADKLLDYLNENDPKVIIFNGGFLSPFSNTKDDYNFKNDNLIRRLKELANRGTNIYYISSNENEFTYFFRSEIVKNIMFKKELILYFQNSKYWFLPAQEYLSLFTKPKLLRWSLRYRWAYILKRIRINTAMEKFYNPSKSLNKYLNDFEKVVTEKAYKKDYNYVVCGLMPKAVVRRYMINKNSIGYLSSGNWEREQTILELRNNAWNIHRSTVLKILNNSRATSFDQSRKFSIFPLGSTTAFN